MQQFKVNWHLSGLNGKEYAPGSLVSLDHADAEPLVNCGVLTAVGEPVAVAVGSEVTDPAALGKLSKTEIAVFAKERLGLELNPDKLTKDAMLAEIAARTQG